MQQVSCVVNRRFRSCSKFCRNNEYCLLYSSIKKTKYFNEHSVRPCLVLTIYNNIALETASQPWNETTNIRAATSSDLYGLLVVLLPRNTFGPSDFLTCMKRDLKATMKNPNERTRVNLVDRYLFTFVTMRFKVTSAIKDV